MQKGMLYIITRLFSPEDRRLSVETERVILKCLQDEGIGTLKTFVPYRDTEQETVQVENKAKYIYEADVQRLLRSRALIGFLNGIAKDEGICFEIGYAYALGITVFVGVTDFFKIKIPGKKPVEIALDPVLLNMVTELVHITNTTAQGTYEEQQSAHITACMKKLISLANPYLTETQQILQPKNGTNDTKNVHLEILGGQYEWAHIIEDMLTNKLGNTFRITTSQRFSAENLETVENTEDVLKLGRQDIDDVLNADIVVICADSAEMDAGSATLHGFARGLNKYVILYDSKTTGYIANGGHVMSRNLMIDQSADYIAKTIDEIAGAIAKWVR